MSSGADAVGQPWGARRKCHSDWRPDDMATVSAIAAPMKLHFSRVSCPRTTPSDTLFARIRRAGEAVGTNRRANCQACAAGCGHNS